MEIRQLRHFVSVADTLNFHRAAEQNRLTQQAISKSIMQLESEIGWKLLDRDRQSVRLTSFGDLLLPYARTILAEVQRFDDLLSDVVGRRFGQLKIGASPTMSDDIVPRTLRAFCAKHPRILVSVEQGDFARLRDLLLRGDLDVILSIGPDAPQGHLIEMIEVAQDRNIVAVRAGHALAEAPADPRRLAEFPYIALQNYPRGDAYLARLFAPSDLPVPQARMKTVSAGFALTWVQESDFWTVVPRQLAARFLRDGGLAVAGTAIDDVSWPLIVATRRHATRSPAVRSYIEIVTALEQAA